MVDTSVDIKTIVLVFTGAWEKTSKPYYTADVMKPENIVALLYYVFCM